MSIKDELSEDEFEFVKNLIVQETTTTNYWMRGYPEDWEDWIPEKYFKILESLSDKFEIENPDSLDD